MAAKKTEMAIKITVLATHITLHNWQLISENLSGSTDNNTDHTDL